MILSQISQEKIVEIVMKEVSKAQNEILTTMLLSEEKMNPLSAQYHTLLQRKVKKGIQLKRLGFGSVRDYKEQLDKYTFTGFYDFRYHDMISAYQRMILIDEKVLFFGINNLFFTTENKDIIKGFKDYFVTHFQGAEK
jgi:hypothetical protein